MTRDTIQRILRFIVVGGTANGLGLVVFQSLVWLGFAPEFASFVGFFPAFGCAYVLNRYWTFESNRVHREALVRYFLATALVVVLQILLLSALHRLGGVLPILGQIIALAVAIPVNFLILRHWVFTETQETAKL